ncbi:glyoxylate reductase [Vulcanisaeta moutnovskia 768-28]|uniref:Glyoxylate reductase n=1 Tax=Vulcanisaeta moutnovskia (strain 768-28) TaxID=985053 RepID=F0QUA9_VULM7|nr:D-glycerate dehydrogenase [Vulcanisaeta moutnovskia]ADY00649.1 glyoxylate reductase [Vulcanisaeta moutnovskia 768-28]
MVGPCVFISRSNLPSIIYTELNKLPVEIRMWKETGPMWGKQASPPREVWIDVFKNCVGAIVTLGDVIDRSLLNEAEKLFVISTYSVGVDHIDVKAATEKGIYVTHTPEVLVEAVADLAMGLLIALGRKIVLGDRLVRIGGIYDKWGWLLGTEIHNATLGIVGLGNIGTALARRAKAFDMKVIYWSRTRKPHIEFALGIEYRPLESVLSESDFVVITIAATPETRHLINEERIRLMKKTAYLINVARGDIVDTNALVKALKEGWIAGAALDVFEEEPLPSTHELTKFDNVVLTPHIGSATYETRERMAEIAVRNLINVLMGKRPLYLANPEVLSIRPLQALI